MNKLKIFKPLIIVLLTIMVVFWAMRFFKNPAQKALAESELITQRQAVDLLISDALQAFKSPLRSSDAGFTGKLPNNLEIVHERLQKAFELEPYRVDLLFSSASAAVFNKKIDQAISLYQKILTLAPEDIDAHSYLATWFRFKDENASFEKEMKILSELNPARRKELEQVFAVIDKTATMPIFDALTDVQVKTLKAEPTAIMTLGYALNPDGSMHDILIKRLEKTLEIAHKLPNALIVVTGGVPKNNKTEAKLMADWLVAQGISSSRIYQDNYARTTVENALFSRYILSANKIANTIVISSGSHVRRAQALLEIACWQSGPRNMHVFAVAAPDKPLDQLQRPTQSDWLGLYRDSLKAMGLWSFRSYPLEER